MDSKCTIIITTAVYTISHSFGVILAKSENTEMEMFSKSNENVT